MGVLGIYIIFLMYEDLSIFNGFVFSSIQLILNIRGTGIYKKDIGTSFFVEICIRGPP